jgi:hypothetical protein
VKTNLQFCLLKIHTYKAKWRRIFHILTALVLLKCAVRTCFFVLQIKSWEIETSVFFRNVNNDLPGYTTSPPTRQWKCVTFGTNLSTLQSEVELLVASQFSSTRRNIKLSNRHEECWTGAVTTHKEITEKYTYISNIGNTPTTKKGVIPHKKIKGRKAHNNCLHKTSNNNRRKTKASTAHSSITTTLMD